jgi:glycosyltransferase involved in cell wall biosynthesis
MRIAMLLHKSVEHDSRVRRAARALAREGHEVTVLHLPRTRGEFDGEIEGFTVRSVTPPEWVRGRLPSIGYRLVFLGAFVLSLRRLRPDAVHAHDAAMLAPGWLGVRATRGRLVYDSHEFAVGVPYRERAWAWGVATLERLLVPRCDAVITVSDGIADRLQALYGLRQRPVVVRNLPDPVETDPHFEAPDLRKQLGINREAPLVLHLGAVSADRGCEALVRAMAEVPDAQLLFLGADDEAYSADLWEQARRGGMGHRVHLRPSVPVAEIRAHTRQATVGVSLLEDTCENHRLALPNKVFEYLAAGVPVLASDLPELRRLLAERPGAVLVDAEEERAVGDALRALVDAPRRTEPNPFRWEEEAARLGTVYTELDPRSRTGAERAVVLVRNGVSHDARVLREARLLESLGFETTVVGVATGATRHGSEQIDGVRIVQLELGSRLLRKLRRRIRPRRGGPSPVASTAGPSAATNGALPSSRTSPGARLRRLAATADFYRRGVGLVRRVRPDLIHANDYNTAWIGVLGKWLTGARLVYDSHELWPDRNLRPEPRGWLLFSEALFVRVADEVITTSPGYAAVLARRYRIDSPRLVRNVPVWRSKPDPDRLPGDPPLAVYFGALTRNRGLTTALRALALVPNLRMRFIGPEAWGYRGDLNTLAAELDVTDRLEILDPVPPDQAASVLADADLGLALIEPVCLSYRMTLPNKLYEYVAAGLPVLSSEVPVLAAEVREHGLGLVTDSADPAAVAAAIEAMIEPAAQAGFRASVNALADVIGWGIEQRRLASVYESLSSSG